MKKQLGEDDKERPQQFQIIPDNYSTTTFSSNLSYFWRNHRPGNYNFQHFYKYPF